MAKEEIDQFSETLPDGKPAYPKYVYLPTDKNYPNGEPICTSHLVKNSDEHKELLGQKKQEVKKEEQEVKKEDKKEGDPGWGKK